MWTIYQTFMTSILNMLQVKFLKVLTLHRRKYVTLILKRLHWLPVNYHCMLKTKQWFIYFYTAVLAILDPPCR